ncbi:hypothetical protein CJP74_02605 [Psittacicella melopsittaci]|uniref:Solute-binding protein family 5 domain-containing protein n=1 Tax=Psittacicella melopsittaci TaxID=2028576 RepID=A0A3A1Y6C0_9GAMM|nr:peptide ABC transporter substrate-binding protein [Psittacicella melopsittaci]RIY33165.1 hypothetical protein CJP74_02605 [Psittacicella melopsittaci]
MFNKLAITTALAVALSLPAWAQVPAGVKLAEQQTLRLAFPASPDTLDPTLLKYSSDLKTLRPVFDTITRLNNEGKYIPVAATGWDVSDDGLTWTFHLRPEAKWQDGKPVTAQDFVYAWQRLTDPQTAAPFGDYLVNANVLNAKEIFSKSKPASSLGVTALDDYTLQVQLTTPTPWLAQMFSATFTAPVRQDLIEKYGEQWTQIEHLVGNGPYKITAYTFNEKMVYSKWDGYWDAANVHLTQVQHDYIKDSNIAYLRYLAGEYPITEIPSQYVAQATRERPQEIIKVLSGRTVYFAFNPHRFSNQIVQALSLLTDRKLLTGQVLHANIPTSVFGAPYLEDLQEVKQQAWFSNTQAQNNQKAIELLQEAGYTPENPLVLTLSQIANGDNNKLYIATANIWKVNSKGAVILKQEALEPTALYAKFPKLDYDFIYAQYGFDYPQASTLYNAFLSNSPINNKRFIDPEFDRVLLQANVTADAQERAQLYAQANDILVSRSPFAPVWYQEILYLKKPELGGFYQGLALQYYRDMYIIAN